MIEVLTPGLCCRRDIVGQKEKLAIMEHALKTGHKVQFRKTKLLARIRDTGLECIERI